MFVIGVLILLIGCPALTAALVFGIPYLRKKKKEQYGGYRTALFKSPRLENHHTFRYRR